MKNKYSHMDIVNENKKHFKTCTCKSGKIKEYIIYYYNARSNQTYSQLANHPDSAARTKIGAVEIEINNMEKELKQLNFYLKQAKETLNFLKKSDK